jgi:hypothetical protein
MASKKQTTEVAKVSPYANCTTFRKGDGRARRTAGTPKRRTRECKEVIADCFEMLGGLEALVAWAKSTPKRTDAFYSQLYPRLLSEQLDPRSHKDVEYLTSEEVVDKFGAAGMSLELIERLRRDEEAEKPKMTEHVRVD